MADITSILATDALADSRAVINTNFTACQACFAGSAAPASPVAGQLWYDSTNYALYICWNGTDFVKVIPDTSKTCGGLLPLTAGAQQIITGETFHNYQKIRNVGTPLVDADVAVKSYVDDRIEAHTHAGNTTNDSTGNPSGDRMTWSSMKCAGTETGNSLIQIANNVTDVEHRRIGATSGTSSVNAASGWTDLASADVYSNANEKKYIFVGAWVSAAANVFWKITRSGPGGVGEVDVVASTEMAISSPYQFTLNYCVMNQPSVANTYTWKLRAYVGVYYNRFIFVL